MMKWRCAVCGYVYDPQVGDPESGVSPPVPFEALSNTWGCPECGADKTLFEPYQEYKEENTPRDGY